MVAEMASIIDSRCLNNTNILSTYQRTMLCLGYRLLFTMLLSYGYGWQQNQQLQKIQGNCWPFFDGHEDQSVQFGVYCLIECIPGFTRSHCLPPLGECLRRIAPVAAMVNEFIVKPKITNKILLLASNLWYNQHQPPVVYESFIPKTVTGSRRVLTTTMDDGQGLLLASASSMGLRTWVQQGLPVTLVTDVHTQVIQEKLRRTVDLTIQSKHWIHYKDSCVASFSERIFFKPEIL